MLRHRRFDNEGNYVLNSITSDATPSQVSFETSLSNVRDILDMKSLTVPEENILKKILETKNEIKNSLVLYEQFWIEKIDLDRCLKWLGMGDDVMNYTRIAIVRQVKLQVLGDLGALRSTLIRLFDTLALDGQELQRYSEINRSLANELEQSDCHSLAEMKRSLADLQFKMANTIQRLSARDESSIMDTYFGEKKTPRLLMVHQTIENSGSPDTNNVSRKRKQFGVLHKGNRSKKTHRELHTQIPNTSQQQDENQITSTNSTQFQHQSLGQLKTKEPESGSMTPLSSNPTKHTHEQDLTSIDSVYNTHDESRDRG